MIGGVSAGFPRRAGALFYDGILLAAVLVIATDIPVRILHAAILPETVGVWAYVYRAFLVCLIGAYFVLNWMHSGQTLGMRAWHLYAVDERGGRLRALPALMRFVCAVAAWLPAGLGVFWLYLDPQRLALHDRVAKTRLIHWSRR